MADHFDAFAYNPATNQLLAGAQFEVFAEDDLARETPLPVFEATSGAVLAPLMSNNVGALPQFSVDGDPETVILKSGSFETRLRSAEGQRGMPGKSAFEYAQEGGYTGTEANLAAGLAHLVVGGRVNESGRLILTLIDDSEIDAGAVVGPAGPVGAAVRILGVVATEEDLPEGAEPGDGYRIDDNLWTWTGEAWLDLGPYTGESPQLREFDGWVQSKLPSETEWANLFEIPTTGASSFGALSGNPTDNTDLAAALAARALDDAVVKLTGAQTITGEKEFDTAPVVPDGSFSVAKIIGLATALAAKAADDAVAKLTGDQTIAGVKTFSSAPIVPTQSTSDESTKAASTAHVKARIAATSIEDLADVQELTSNGLLGTNGVGEVIIVVPDEDVTAADIAYDSEQSIAEVLALHEARIIALEASAPILINTVPPTITGTFAVGSTVGVDEGEWTVGGVSAEPDSYEYVWKRNGTPIVGATSSTYALVSGDIGTNTITVTVTAVKASHTDGEATSGAITVAAGAVDLELVGVPAATASSGASINISKPSGTLADDDLLIAALRSQTSAGASDFTPASGSGSWPRIGPAWPGSSSDNRVQGFYAHRITDVGSEPSSYTFDRTSAATRNAGLIFALRGAAASGYVHAASTDYLGTAIAGGRRVASINVTEDGCIQFIIAAAEFTAGNTHVPTTSPAGFTLVAQAVTAGDIGTTSRTYVGVWMREVDAGATGTSDVVWGSPGSPVAHSVVIKPGS